LLYQVLRGLNRQDVPQNSMASIVPDLAGLPRTLIQIYRRTLSVFEPIRRRLTGGELTAT
jgi:hypothetical protein